MKPPPGVCGVHLGSTATMPSTWQRLMSHLEASRLSPAPMCRENYLKAEGDDQSDWVIELQQPLLDEGVPSLTEAEVRRRVALWSRTSIVDFHVRMRGG
jgi:hypothetical protein